MISYAVYKMVHYVGIFLLVFGLGGVLISHLAGFSLKGKAKFLGFLTHGLGMFLVLLGGFGMLARLGITSGLPGWIYAKLGIWLLLGLAISLAKRKPSYFLSVVIITLLSLAPYVAIYKPL